ncbi:MAG TPA: NAD(P)-dependent oxidoreductase [Candidatus Baltobacteraceae bacterium]|jgi:3-hydroxyisobutyrate dehydrogenase-like beta-hydroxyacid dehydrogenase|nr:NAD(P)-dependent oxidoreductase [Candidatus Baltobacteraceae bacterium]
MMNVGVVGLGKMGSAIARNLLDRKYRLWVWNRSRPAAGELATAGAVACSDIGELLAAVDAVIVMLWGDEVARAVTLEQIIPAARKGQLVIESSTLSPAMYEKLAGAAAARGVDFLACPVIGSVDSARAGSLTLLPGGTRDAFERARELLGAMGSTITFTGSPAASGFLKLGSNSILGIIADSLRELLRVTESAGVDRALAIDLFVRAFERAGGKRQQLMDRDTAARFSAGALLKDLRLAKEARASVGQDAHVLDCVLEEFEKAVDGGIGDRDYIAVALAGEAVKAS